MATRRNAFVLLAATVCASEVEKREAEPSYGYRSRYTIPSYSPSYRHGHVRHFGVPASYTHSVRSYHKRSADSEPSVVYSSATYTPVAPVYAPYSVHGYHKRSAEADASHGISHGIYSHTPITYGGHSNHGLYKRSADPEAEASTGYYSTPVYGSAVSYGHHIYRRSAHPSTSYAPVHYRPVSLYQTRYY
ncbi:uncharacterized protein LOC119599239 [Penaeus monodon]|uniref:uncharacterized protein LOC119599239 n=1 Tax=Penaeus monodon TaxID=6687 RepID=UPI0018A735DD|nr:uncharacterized protein LOC119599239 [Penaeus monodon]